MAHAHRTTTENERRLLGLALGDASVLREALGFDMDRRSHRNLDHLTASLVVLAALVTVGGTEMSFGSAVEAAFAAGADPEDLAGVLVSLVPVAGLAKVRDAAGRIVRSIGSEPDVQRTFVRIVSECPVRLFVSSG
jgi:alkylhydroperoxidase/carboxymuconolactone decarboxylase family protein YurZ